MAAETKPKQNTGPNAAYVLLTAISRAVDVGVEPGKVVTIVDMAREAAAVSAEGPRQQAPIWRRCADTLNRYSDAIKPQGSESTP